MLLFLSLKLLFKDLLLYIMMMAMATILFLLRFYSCLVRKDSHIKQCESGKGEEQLPEKTVDTLSVNCRVTAAFCQTTVGQQMASQLTDGQQVYRQ